MNDPSRRTVLFVVPSLRLGGAERQVIDLANGLSPERWRVHLLTFEPDERLLPRLDQSRVRYHHTCRRWKMDPKPSGAIARVIREASIELLHATLPIALFHARIANLLSGRHVPEIVAVHATGRRSLKWAMYDRLLYVPLMRRCRRIVTVCHAQREDLASRYPDLAQRMVTVHNGVDAVSYTNTLSDDETRAFRTRMGIREGDLVVGIVADLRREKGHEYALQALKLLRDRNRPVRILILGDGERRQTLECMCRDLGINDSVAFLGFRTDPRSCVSAMDAVLLPSFTGETFSMALLESLLLGKPVISTRIGGAHEIVQEGVNGYLVEPRNPAQIAGCIEKWVQSPGLLREMSSRARQSIEARYTLEAMIRKTERVMCEALA